MKSKIFSSFSSGANLASSTEGALIGRHWGWLLAAGALFVVLGVVAFSMPIASTVSITYGLAGVLVAVGLVRFVQAWRLRHLHGSPTRFLQSIVSVVVGAIMLRYPGGGMMGIALALSIYFFIGAATQWTMASETNYHSGFNWGYVAAVFSFLLGVYMIATFPLSALWVPGTLLGLDLVVSGAALIVASFGLRKLHSEFHVDVSERQRMKMSDSEAPEHRDAWH